MQFKIVIVNAFQSSDICRMTWSTWNVNEKFWLEFHVCLHPQKSFSLKSSRKIPSGLILFFQSCRHQHLILNRLLTWTLVLIWGESVLSRVNSKTWPWWKKAFLHYWIWKKIKLILFSMSNVDLCTLSLFSIATKIQKWFSLLMARMVFHKENQPFFVSCIVHFYPLSQTNTQKLLLNSIKSSYHSHSKHLYNKQS